VDTTIERRAGRSVGGGELGLGRSFPAKSQTDSVRSITYTISNFTGREALQSERRPYPIVPSRTATAWGSDLSLPRDGDDQVNLGGGLTYRSLQQHVRFLALHETGRQVLHHSTQRSSANKGASPFMSRSIRSERTFLSFTIAAIGSSGRESVFPHQMSCRGRQNARRAHRHRCLWSKQTINFVVNTK
jgi:hypothetical protein